MESTRTSPPLCRLIAVAFAGWAALATSLARGDPPAMGDPAGGAGMGDAAMGEPAMGEPTPSLTALSDADAAPILEALRKAAKARNGAEVIPVLESIAGKTHKEFEPALAKLLGHLS